MSEHDAALLGNRLSEVGVHVSKEQSWTKISAPLVNMIKEGSQNESALLILFIFYLKKNKSHKCNLSVDNKNLKWGELL